MASVYTRGGRANRHGYWYVSWFEYVGNRRRRKSKCTYTTDKSVAERIANKYEADAALRREGVIDPALEAIGNESQRTIESHLTDYKCKLEAGGRSEQYIAETVGYVQKIVKASGFHSASDIEADAVNRFANVLKVQNKPARKIHAYLPTTTKWPSCVNAEV